MHVNDIAKQLPFTIEPHEIEYLSLIEALRQIRARTRKASNIASLCLYSVRHNDDLEPVDEALFESCNKLFQLSEEIRFLEKFLVNMEGCA